MKVCVELKSKKRKNDNNRRNSREEVEDFKAENFAVALITTVLAMRQKWKETAYPRIKAFLEKYAHVKMLQDLKDLMDSMNEREFCKKVFNFRIGKTPFPRYVMLKKLIKAYCTCQKEKGFDDWEAIQDLAKSMDIRNLENDPVGRIEGVGLATCNTSE